MRKPPADLTGRRFGRWSVIKRAANTQQGSTRWQCLCECGNLSICTGAALRGGHTTSCGCRQRELLRGKAPINFTHGASKTRIYRTWQGMRDRCGNPHATYFTHYGGRGISVCAEWEDFSVFKKWALRAGYTDALTIERRDVNGNYTPENCTWIPMAKQSANRRFLRKAPTGEPWYAIARRNGISPTAFGSRMFRGWSSERAATAPVTHKFSSSTP